MTNPRINPGASDLKNSLGEDKQGEQGEKIIFNYLINLDGTKHYVLGLLHLCWIWVN